MWQADMSVEEHHIEAYRLGDDSQTQVATSGQPQAWVACLRHSEYEELYQVLCKSHDTELKQFVSEQHSLPDLSGMGGPSCGEIKEHEMAYWFLKGLKSYRPEWSQSKEGLARSQCQLVQHSHGTLVDEPDAKQMAANEFSDQTQRSMRVQQDGFAAPPKSWQLSRFTEISPPAAIHTEPAARPDPLRSIEPRGSSSIQTEVFTAPNQSDCLTEVLTSVQSDNSESEDPNSDREDTGITSWVDYCQTPKVVAITSRRGMGRDTGRHPANLFTHSCSRAALKLPPRSELGHRGEDHEHI